MGPFTLVDTIGLDVCHSVVDILLEEYGSRMKPAALWEPMYTSKRFGMKTKKGFYTYGTKREVDEEMLQLIQKVAQPAPGPFQPERLLLPMINEAALCLQEGISSPADIELGMIAGLGFPQDKGGILHYADQIGIDHVLQELDAWHKKAGERFWPAPLLRRMVKANHLGVKSRKGFFTYEEEE